MPRHVEFTCKCGAKLSTQWDWARSCGAIVCDNCEQHYGNPHQPLVRCFCGWAASGGNGREELEELGERIDPDDVDEYEQDEVKELDLDALEYGEGGRPDDDCLEDRADYPEGYRS